MILHAAQTQRDAARDILGDFAVAWARHAATGGAVSEVEGAPDRVVLEPFAGRDHPRPPLCARWIGELRAEAARPLSGFTLAALADEDPVKIAWLRDRLGPEVTEGEVRVDLTEGAPTILSVEALPPSATTLAIIDAPASAGIGIGYTRAVLEREGATLLLRFPVADLRRLAAFRGTPVADLPPYPRRLVEGCSALLDDRRHGWLSNWGSARAAADPGAADEAVVEALAQRLRADRRVVRTIRLETSERAAPEVLVFATGTPDSLLVLNEILVRARQRGAIAWPDDDEMVRYAPRAELELFAAEGDPNGGRDRVVDRPRLARWLTDRFGGRTVMLAEVTTDLQEFALIREDVHRALKALRRDGLAHFRSLGSDAEITFPGAAGARRSPRPRRPAGKTLALELEPATE